jgi:hypothetical protein
MVQKNRLIWWTHYSVGFVGMFSFETAFSLTDQHPQYLFAAVAFVPAILAALLFRFVLKRPKPEIGIQHA